MPSIALSLLQLCLIAPVPCLAAESSGKVKIDPKALDALVLDGLNEWHVPGCAVAIVHHGEVVYLKGFGVKELSKQDPVTPDSLFAIGSCTKAFTTTAMAMMVDEGKMGWDDLVRRHIDYFHLADPLADANVTLRDLVTHRTGLRSHDLLWYHSPLSREERIRRLAFLQPDQPFRTTFQYQTIMFTAAGMAVESASRASWDSFVRHRIFEPLGMGQTCCITADALRSPDHASPHRRNREDRVDVIPWYSFTEPEPAGSINSTARDLSAWLRFHLQNGSIQGKRLVSAKSLGETHTPQIVLRVEGLARALHPDTEQISYGMAWVIQDYHGHRLVSHAGAIDGFRAHLTLLPESGLGIAILANLDQTRLNLALSNALIDEILSLPTRNWNRHLLEQIRLDAEAQAKRRRERDEKRHHNTTPSRELGAYIGVYEDAAYGRIKIALQQGTLLWQWRGFSVPLRHFHYDTFLGQHDSLGEFQVVFSLGADGELASMKVLDPLGIEFKKIEVK